MSRLTLLSLLGVLIVGMIIGVIAGGRFTPASAQDAPAADVQTIVQPSPVVSAVPFQSRTDYEQDPFETNRLRRTTTTVTRLVIVRADGTMELKDTP